MLSKLLKNADETFATIKNELICIYSQSEIWTLVQNSCWNIAS